MCRGVISSSSTRWRQRFTQCLLTHFPAAVPQLLPVSMISLFHSLHYRLQGYIFFFYSSYNKESKIKLFMLWVGSRSPWISFKHVYAYVNHKTPGKLWTKYQSFLSRPNTCEIYLLMVTLTAFFSGAIRNILTHVLKFSFFFL